MLAVLVSSFEQFEDKDMHTVDGCPQHLRTCNGRYAVVREADDEAIHFQNDQGMHLFPVYTMAPSWVISDVYAPVGDHTRLVLSESPLLPPSSPPSCRLLLD